MERTIVSTTDAPQPIGQYSQAVRVKGGELVFMAGQVSLDKDGNLVGEGDAGAQTRQIFENLEKVLQGVGGSFSDVLEVMTYVVGRDAVAPNREARTELYPRLFPNGDYPASTLLIVDGLARPEFLVEIKAVAALR